MKIGDKLVCINNSITKYNSNNRDDWGQIDLIVDNIYTISQIELAYDDDFVLIYIKEFEEFETNWYFNYRFITLKEYRRKKLESISESRR